jgi:NADH-quinone oxidoreductase subunit L
VLIFDTLFGWIRPGAGVIEWLWLIAALPLAGFLLLAVAGRWLPRWAIGAVGVGSVALAAGLAFITAAAFLTTHAPGTALSQTLWPWLSSGDLHAVMSLRLDRLSTVMMLVITGVGSLILLYAAGYMADDDGYRRFFAYMDLFVFFMLVLVLAGDLLLLFLGWEGVGLCSYLLIGFWYRDPDNGAAARKAFIATRIGDAAFVAGLLVLFTGLGTTDIPELLARAVQQWPAGSVPAVAAALLLLGGAVGKSAQLPLQVWLPDAMAGPTPVSALIHAATMVTAGVYLIARLLPLFELAPAVLALVGAIGALTLLLAAYAALGQNDIKRILAYSTISQIGYMIMALGVGAVSAAMFHLVSHAFFKALLFLAAGGVILSFGGEHDIRRMGGLWRRRPVVFAGFLAGAASLAAVPLVTAGFYSKDLIISTVLAAGGTEGRLLWLAGTLGAFLTGIYSFRPLFMVFFGRTRSDLQDRPGWIMALPMLVLTVLALAGGLIDVPALLGGLDASSAAHESGALAPELIVVAAGLLGILVAYIAFATGRASILPHWLERAAHTGLGFDRLYDLLLVRPFLALTRAIRQDPVDRAFEGLGRAAAWTHRWLSATQTGRLRWYASATTLGGVLVVGAMLLLAVQS